MTTLTELQAVAASAGAADAGKLARFASDGYVAQSLLPLNAGFSTADALLPRDAFVVVEDFDRILFSTSAAPADSNPMPAAWRSSTGVSVPVYTQTTAGRLGIVQVSVTSVNGYQNVAIHRARLSKHTNHGFGGRLLLAISFRIVTLPTAGENYQIRWGLRTEDFAIGSHNGLGLALRDGVNSGRFYLLKTLGTTDTTWDTGVTPVAGTWYTITIELDNLPEPNAVVTINGTQALSTNVGALGNNPTPHAFMHVFRLEKVAGTTIRNFDIDYMATVLRYEAGR